MIVLQLLALLAFALTFAMLVGAVRNWPQIGFIYAAIITIVAWEIPSLPPLASPGGYSIQIMDVFSLVFILVGFLNWGQVRENIRQGIWFWAPLGLLLFVAISRGTADFGLNVAVNDARGFMSLAAATFWAVSLDWSHGAVRRTYGCYVVGAGWALTIVSFYHVFRFGIGGAADFVQADGIEQTGRILVAGQAMVLGLCGIACLEIWTETRRKLHFWSSIAFMTTVIVAQHRSVWISIASALIAYCILSPRRNQILAIKAVFLICWLGLIVVVTGLADGVLSQIVASSENSSTYNARTYSWEYLVNQAWTSGPEAVTFGSPFGAGYDRIEPNGNYVTFQPHNIYVSLFLRLGVAGLVLYAVLLIGYLIKSIKNRDAMSTAALIAVMVYGWAYGPTWYIFAFVAVALVGGSTSLQRSGISRPSITTTLGSARKKAYQ